jgi:prevent-host-death family protein
MTGIRALRNDLAAAVRRAAAGQRVVITVDGRAVAQLGPVEPEHGQSVLADLVAAGTVIAPRRHSTEPPGDGLGPPVRVWSGVRLDRALKDIRG